MSNFPTTDPLFSWYGYTPHPSTVLQKKGIAYLDELEQDTHLKGQLNTRAIDAIIPGYKINVAAKGDARQREQIRDFVQYNLDEIQNTFIQVMFGLCDAFGKGFVVKEPVFEKVSRGRWSGKFRLRKLNHIPQKYVGFDIDESGDVKSDGLVFTGLINKGGTKVRYRYADFVHVTHGLTSSPYGDPLSLRCAFWTWIKREIPKFWAVFAETFGSPTVKVELPQGGGGNDETNEAKAEKIVRDFRSRSGIVIPKGFVIGLLEATRSGEVGFDNFIDRCNKEMSKIILGATLSVEGAGKSQSGGYSLGKQHGDITNAYASFDSLWLEYVVNQQIIPRIVDLNFETEFYPVFEILDDNIADLIGKAQAVAQLVQSGVEIPVAWLHDRLKIPRPQNGEPILIPVQTITSQPASPSGVDNKLFNRFAVGVSPAAPVMFAETDRAAILRNLEQSTFQSLQPEIVKLFDKLFEKADQLPDNDRITAIQDPKLNVGPIKKIFTRALFANYVYGKAVGTTELEAKGVEVKGKNDPMPDLPAAFGRWNPRALVSSFVAAHGSATFELDPAAIDSLPKPDDLLTLLAADVNLTAAELTTVQSVYDAAAQIIAGIIKNEVENLYNAKLLAKTEAMSLREFKQSLQAALEAYAGDLTTELTTVGDLTANKIELHYRNAAFKAYSDGKTQLATDEDSTVWGYRYNAILDSRVRDNHAALDGVILPKDHPFWSIHTPPWEHNCRCDREFVTYEDIRTGRYTETPADQIPNIPANPNFS